MNRLETIINSIILLLFTLSPYYATACKLKFAAPDVKPYYWSDEGVHKGATVDFLNLVAKQTACEITYHSMPWARAVYELELGKIDLTIAFYKKEREFFARYATNPINKIEFVIFAKHLHAAVNNIPFLFKNNERVIYVKNWHLGRLSKQLKSNRQLAMPINSISEGVKLIKANRAPAFLGPKNSTLYTLKKLKLNDSIVVKSQTLESMNAYILFSKKSVPEKIYKLVNKDISRLMKINTMNKSINKYIK